MRKLLGFANAKTIKGEALGYRTAIQYFLSASLSGRNVCPKASLGCMFACLVTAGRGIFKAIREARLARTLFYFNEPEAYRVQLAREIQNLISYCKKKGLKPAVRLNGTSDIPKLAIEFARMFPEVQFYDYTKLISTLRRDDLPANYDLTFSRSESNEEECREALRLGFRVAVVSDIEDDFELREQTGLLGVPVIDGDEHDLTFLRPKRCILRLTPKGLAKKDATGFVVWEGA